MLVLPQRASVWRQTPNAQGGRTETQIYADIACLIVPVSGFDRQQAYALESTHIVWVPRWLDLLKEDQLRYGRRVTLFGDVSPYVFVVNGRRRFAFGLLHRAFYCTERD